MIPVAEALSRILTALEPLPAEIVSVADAYGRVLAAPAVARVTQPPAALSAMDGYAVRAADIVAIPAVLRRIAEIPAGASYAGPVNPGDCVRIFTGAPVPDGADTVVIQENTRAEGDRITVLEPTAPGRNIRGRGIDFRAGESAVPAGRRLSPRDVGLIAAMNVPWVRVHRQPRVAILASGNEIVMPGEPIGPNQIVSSNALALSALVQACGGVPVNLGIALDTAESLAAMMSAAENADLLLTTGGASEGDYDLVRSVLTSGRTGTLDFWKIALRPGKPLMFGHIGTVPVIGLPGNPVSSQVCAQLFVRPALRLLQGLPPHVPSSRARLGAALAANDRRRDHLRARLAPGEDGIPVATPFPVQDSAITTGLAAADCLIVRPPHAPAAAVGEMVEILTFVGEMTL